MLSPIDDLLAEQKKRTDKLLKSDFSSRNKNLLIVITCILLLLSIGVGVYFVTSMSKVVDIYNATK